jgi:16S rRNA (uracil1498-N3)-methyltransferase
VRSTVGYREWIAVSSQSRRWMLVPDGTTVAAMAPPQGSLEMLVGPEGGLSDRERDLAMLRGFEPVALGQRVLRTETAPIVAMAALHALWGDFSGKEG